MLEKEKVAELQNDKGIELLNIDSQTPQNLSKKRKKTDKRIKDFVRNLLLVVIPFILIIIIIVVSRRIYKRVYLDINPRNVILCPFDNAIRVMQQFGRGVYGAENAPFKIFEKLFGDEEIIHTIPYVEQLNHGFNEDTYRAHRAISRYISKLDKPLVVLGGDHSITYPIIKGLSSSKTYKNKKYGLIYFSPHYELRELEGQYKNIISNGNSIYRILKDKSLKNVIKGQNIVAIGIKRRETEIFNKMEKIAKESGITTFYLDEINEQNYIHLMKRALGKEDQGTDGIYLSFDLNVLDDKYVPGAGWKKEKGLELEWAKKMVKIGKFIAADFVEASSRIKNHKNEYLFNGDEKLEMSAKSAVEIIKVLKLTNFYKFKRLHEFVNSLS